MAPNLSKDIKNLNTLVGKIVADRISYGKVPWDFVEENQDLAWDWFYMSSRDDFTLELALKYVDKKGVSLRKFSKNAPLAVIEQYIDKDWDWYTLSNRHDDVTWDFVLNHLEGPRWDWDALSGRSDVTWDIIEKHPKIKWAWREFSSREDLTWDIVEKHIDEKWDWYTLGKRADFSWDFVMKHIDKDWDWKSLINRDGFPLDMVYELKMKGISFDWIEIYRLQKDKIRGEAAQIIQDAWKTCNHNPRFLICRKKVTSWADKDIQIFDGETLPYMAKNWHIPCQR